MTPARALRVGCLGENLIMQRSHLHTTPKPHLSCPTLDSNPSISSKYFFKPVGHGSGIRRPVYNENGVDKITHVRREVTLILSMIHTAQPVLLTRPINNKDVCTHECFFTHSALGTEACAHVWIFMNVCILLAHRLSQKVWLKMTLSHLTKLEDM